MTEDSADPTTAFCRVPLAGSGPGLSSNERRTDECRVTELVHLVLNESVQDFPPSLSIADCAAPKVRGGE